MFLCRWKKYEIHDIVIECAKVSLDPKEASCEEGYATMPESFYPQIHMRPQDCTSSPYTDLHSSYGQKPAQIFMKLERYWIFKDFADVDFFSALIIKFVYIYICISFCCIYLYIFKFFHYSNFLYLKTISNYKE